MKITVEISDSEIDEIRFYTKEPKKGPAIRKLLLNALMLRRRQELVDKFVSGEWGVDLAGFEASEQQHKSEAQVNEQAWRG